MHVKRIWIVAAAIGVALLLIILVGVPLLLNADTYRGRIETALTISLGRPVQLGHLDASILSGSLVANAPSIADDPTFSSLPFLTAKDIHIGVEMAPLIFHHELHITGFTIDQPAITLLRAENGAWNYSSLGGEAKKPRTANENLLPSFTVNHLDIKGGTLTIGTTPATAQPRVYTDLTVSAQNFSFANAFPFTVSGKLPGDGSVDISGNAGPIDQRDASLTPFTAQVSLKHADLVAAGFVEPAQGIAGIADLDAKLVSNGQATQVDGKLHLTQLKLAKNGSASSQPVDAQFSVTQDLRSLSGKITSTTLQIGKAALTLAGAYRTHGNTTSTQMNVNGPNLPIDDLVAFLPSLGVQLPSGSRMQGGTLTLALNINGPTSALAISGPVHVANTQLAGFDLGQKLAGIQSLTGAKTGSTTTIQTLSTNLRYGPEGTQTDNLDAVVTGLGSATGGGSVSPAGALNYHLLVKPSSTGVGGIATQAVGLLPGVFGSTVSQATKNGIPVTIAGTTSNPTFTPDMGKMIGGTIQKQNQPSNPLGKALGGLFGH